MTEHQPTCPICAVYQGRVYTVSGTDPRFPALYATAFRHGYHTVHPNCGHSVHPWVEALATPAELAQAIEASGRPFDVDPRTERQRRAYLDAQQRKREARERLRKRQAALLAGGGSGGSGGSSGGGSGGGRRRGPGSAAEEPDDDELRHHYLSEWVEGSNRFQSVIFKHGVNTGLRVSGVIRNPYGYRQPRAGERRRAERAARFTYAETQAALLQRGISEVTLFRGVKEPYDRQLATGVVEGWTDNLDKAIEFAGPEGVVWEGTFPVERVLAWYDGPGWVTGSFGQQNEWLILAEAPQ